MPLRPGDFAPDARNSCYRFLITRSIEGSVFFSHGLWLSLVERLVRDEEAVGSNPTSPIAMSRRGLAKEVLPGLHYSPLSDLTARTILYIRSPIGLLR